MTGRAGGGKNRPAPEEEPKPPAGEPFPPQAMRGPFDPPRYAYYPRLVPMLIWAMEEACRSASFQALLDQTALRTRQELSLSAQADAQRAVSLSFPLARRVNDGELCLYWFALSLETAAAMSRRMEDNPARRVLRFLLPEYQDALYRLANLYCLQEGPDAWEFLRDFPVIMPGRPLAVCRRPPGDGVCAPWQDAGLWDEMALLILSAAAGQSRLACLQAATRAGDRLARDLFREAGLVCQEHETLLSSLLPRRHPMDRLRTRHYLTAFLYASCGRDETLPGPVRSFAMSEEKHARIRVERTTELLRGADSSIRDLPPFPAPLLLRPCKGCLREAMLGVAQTMRNGRIVPFDEAGQADFRQDGENLRPEEALVPSNRVIRKMIAETGRDYRSETAGRPAEPLKPVGIKAVSGRWLD